MVNQTETAKNFQINTTQKTQPNFITVNELAHMLRKSPSIVQKSWRGWVDKWGFSPIRFGGAKRGRLLFDVRDVDALLKKWSVSQRIGDLKNEPDTNIRCPNAKRKNKSK